MQDLVLMSLTFGFIGFMVVAVFRLFAHGSPRSPRTP